MKHGENERDNDEEVEGREEEEELKLSDTISSVLSERNMRCLDTRIKLH